MITIKEKIITSTYAVRSKKGTKILETEKMELLCNSEQKRLVNFILR